MNYRIDQRRDVVVAAVNSGDVSSLLVHDQLLKQMGNPFFRLRVFHEAPLTFAPTYKYDRHTDTYDSSEKRRTPAWCDRILVRCRDPDRARVVPGSYRRWEVNCSDHRPVSVIYDATVKKVSRERRERERRELGKIWEGMLGALLEELGAWYEAQQLA